MALRSRNLRGNLLFYDTNPMRITNAFGPDVFQVFDDFTNVAVASDAVSNWSVTLVEAGAGESTITRPDASGGALLLTTDANEDDGIEMQLTTGESFGFATTNYLTYFGIRLKISDATQSDFIVGLCITDTTLLGGMSDGVYFEKLDGGTGISFTTEKNASETQTDSLGTIVADTYVVLEFAGTGTQVVAMINGTVVATHTVNICDDELLCPSIHFLTGEAVAKTMTIDWIRAIQVGR